MMKVTGFGLLISLLLFLGAEGSGTTPNIEEIIIGRCHAYQHIINPEVFQDDLRNCTEVLHAFRDAIFGKGRCGVNKSDFDRFVQLTSHRLDPNKDLVLWEGERMQQFVEQYSNMGNRFTSSANLYMPGYLGDYLEFCGDDDGIDYEDCPDYGSCDGEAVFNFWMHSSEELARRAESQVRIMLNGSATTAFRNDTILAMAELPFLDPVKVNVIVIVVHEVDKPRHEYCEKGSLLELDALLDKYGLEHECIENPRDVQFMMCIDHVDSEECIQLFSGSILHNMSYILYLTLFFIWSVFAVK